MKKGIVALMIAACLALGGFTFFMLTTEDRKAPEIQIQDVDITYVNGSDYAELLTGVTATDNREGDVTQNLIVEGVYPNDDGITANVVYVVKDEKNNIAKASRKVKYQADPASAVAGEEANTDEQANTPSQDEVSVDAGNDVVEKTEKDNDAENNLPQAAGTEDSEKPDVSTETDDEDDTEDSVSPGSPVIKLKQSTVTIKRGQSVNRVSYVESITDDKDDKNTLWKQIQIKGDTFDSSTSGTYEQIYYVVDSDGNKSNEAKLTIVVE